MTTTNTQPKAIEMSSVELINKYGDKSKAIRGLTAEGYSRTVIAKALGIRYQHVRNVQVTQLKKDQPE